ncbi:MAG: hypothetical protein IJT97_11265 [Bacteroidaceae bacterium]|nr:hypothetical protein [Bacteroidaceae bacterium]
MGFVNFVMSKLKSVAQAATNDDKIYFPTDGQSIWLNGKEYGADPTSPHFCYFGTCATAGATAEKVVECADFRLVVGAIIGVKFSSTNTASNVTLNVNGTGAKSIWYNNAKYTSTSSSVCGVANRVIFYMWNGEYFVWMNLGFLDGNTYYTGVCSTGATTAAKAASCSNYVLLANSYTLVIFTTANTKAAALTLNINSKGAKPLWINGTVSSATNYTLPAGSYIVYYDGTNYHVRTDGRIPGLGTAATLEEDDVKWPNLMATAQQLPRKFLADGYGMFDVASYVMKRTVSGTAYYVLTDVDGGMQPVSAWAVKGGSWVKPVSLTHLAYSSNWYWMFPQADVPGEPDIVVVTYIDLDGDPLEDVLP